MLSAGGQRYDMIRPNEERSVLQCWRLLVALPLHLSLHVKDGDLIWLRLADTNDARSRDEIEFVVCIMQCLL